MLEQAFNFIIRERVIDFFDIMPNSYVIYSNGMVYSLFAQKFMTPRISKDGYLRIGLNDIYGVNKGYFIHRLVAYAFCQGHSEIYNVVNHIDSNRLNPDYSNLEWVTYKQNTQHAISTGRFNTIGENNPTARFTESEIHLICQGLEKSMKYEDVLIFAGIQVNDKNLNVVSQIRCKKMWNHISDNYNIPESIVRDKPTKYTNEHIEVICQLLLQGKSNREIAQVLDIDVSTQKYYDKFSKVVYGIRNGITYTHITNKYFNN